MLMIIQSKYYTNAFPFRNWISNVLQTGMCPTMHLIDLDGAVYFPDEPPAGEKSNGAWMNVNSSGLEWKG